MATDYQGEANLNILSPSPGLLPYLAGTSAAYNTIDIVRAARHLPAAHASAKLVSGDGPRAARQSFFVLDKAKTYGSGLDLKRLAIAPPSNFGTELPYIEANTLYWPLVFIFVGGLNAAYGNTLAPTSEMLTAAGQSDLPLLGTDCVAAVITTLDHSTFSTILTFPRGGCVVHAAGSVGTVFSKNDPATAANLASTDTSVPLVIAGGSDDTLVDPVTTAQLAYKMCALSTPQNVQRWVYTGLDHDSIAGPAPVNDFVSWTADRFAGSGSYTPTGTPTNPATVTKSCG